MVSHRLLQQRPAYLPSASLTRPRVRRRPLRLAISLHLLHSRVLGVDVRLSLIGRRFAAFFVRSPHAPKVERQVAPISSSSSPAFALAVIARSRTRGAARARDEGDGGRVRARRAARTVPAPSATMRRPEGGRVVAVVLLASFIDVPPGWCSCSRAAERRDDSWTQVSCLSPTAAPRGWSNRRHRGALDDAYERTMRSASTWRRTPTRRRRR